MSISVEEFARRCRLNDREIAALHDILADKAVMDMAERIAERCFCSEEVLSAPEFPESKELSKAWFAACYLGAEYAEKHYEKRGYPLEVLYESMSDLSAWLRNTERNYGVIGISHHARMWETRVFEGAVIRFGRLECNSEHFYSRNDLCDDEGNVILKNGDAVINMHIPEDGPMDIDECKKSMQRMREFFEKYRSDYDWKGFLCESWLLDTQLRDMLPENSNIIKFQDLGYRYDISEYEGTIFRVFGTTPPEEVKNPTTLQRNVQAFLKAGGKFRCEGLFIPRNW